MWARRGLVSAFGNEVHRLVLLTFGVFLVACNALQLACNVSNVLGRRWTFLQREPIPRPRECYRPSRHPALEAPLLGDTEFQSGLAASLI